MSLSPLSHSKLVEELVAQAGSANAFMRSMAETGAPLTEVTLRGWRRGSRPSRPAHMIALSRLSGLSVESVLRAALTPDEAAKLYPEQPDAVLPATAQGAEE